MIGKTLSDYRILSKIGEGGMGDVCRAHDERLDRDAAVKVLTEAEAPDVMKDNDDTGAELRVDP